MSGTHRTFATNVDALPTTNLGFVSRKKYLPIEIRLDRNMNTPLSRQQSRAVDHIAINAFGIPSIVLMENAGRNCAELLTECGARSPVHILCGKGNNGGDGFVIARHLSNHGIDVNIPLIADPDQLDGDALTNFQIVEKSGIPWNQIHSADELPTLKSDQWIVDCLLGTGLTGPVRSPISDVIAAVNQCSANVFSVDIPSGMDCDTGEPLGICIRANVTATLVAPKVGFETDAAAEWLGQLHCIDIGIPPGVLESVRGRDGA